MTYRDELEKLHQLFAEKSQELLKADNAISNTNGFGDMNEMENYKNADRDFKIAANNFHDLAFHCIKNNIDLDNEFMN